MQCAEQITSIICEHFKIKRIELNMKNKELVIYSNAKIQKDKLSCEIIKRGYGPVAFIV